MCFQEVVLSEESTLFLSDTIAYLAFESQRVKLEPFTLHRSSRASILKKKRERKKSLGWRNHHFVSLRDSHFWRKYFICPKTPISLCGLDELNFICLWKICFKKMNVKNKVYFFKQVYSLKVANLHTNSSNITWFSLYKKAFLFLLVWTNGSPLLFSTRQALFLCGLYQERRRKKGTRLRLQWEFYSNSTLSQGLEWITYAYHSILKNNTFF